MFKGCPGAIRFREAVPEYIDCPRCGKELETWSDELLTRCPHCQALVSREREASCIDWCPHAVQCIGEEAYRRLTEEKGHGEGGPLR